LRLLTRGVGQGLTRWDPGPVIPASDGRLGVDAARLENSPQFIFRQRTESLVPYANVPAVAHRLPFETRPIFAPKHRSRRQFRIALQSEKLDEIGSVGSKRESATHAATSVLPGSGNSVVAR
jgi:hypothetical protein